jgi:hypothetical protein
MAKAGWYEDPTNPSGSRWWDGSAWTERTRKPAGDRNRPNRRRTVSVLAVLAVLAVTVAAVMWVRGGNDEELPTPGPQVPQETVAANALCEELERADALAALGFAPDARYSVTEGAKGQVSGSEAVGGCVIEGAGQFGDLAASNQLRVTVVRGGDPVAAITSPNDRVEELDIADGSVLVWEQLSPEFVTAAAVRRGGEWVLFEVKLYSSLTADPSKSPAGPQSAEQSAGRIAAGSEAMRRLLEQAARLR